MAPQEKENKEFSRWFEQWVARIQSEPHQDEKPGDAAGRRENERRRQAENEPILKH